MTQKAEGFYSKLKDFTDRINKTRSKTISTGEFKKEATQIYETWMTEIRPTLIKLHLRDDSYSRIDELFDTLDHMAKERVAEVSSLKEILRNATDRFFREIILNLKTIETPEPTEDLMDSASFLNLDANWSIATCALQLQEVATILVAKRKGIGLDKQNIEKILAKKIKDFSFNYQYEAFSVEVKRMFGVEMPILTMHLRKMRTAVLHYGYNPKPEEKDSIVQFTIGLLKKLASINDAKKS
jgi:hypothetical protein